MEPGHDPDNIFFVLDECPDLLEQTGQNVHGESYKNLILKACPVEYKRVRNASYKKSYFGPVNIRHMVHRLHQLEG